MGLWLFDLICCLIKRAYLIHALNAVHIKVDILDSKLDSDAAMITF